MQPAAQAEAFVNTALARDASPATSASPLMLFYCTYGAGAAPCAAGVERRQRHHTPLTRATQPPLDRLAQAATSATARLAGSWATR